MNNNKLDIIPLPIRKDFKDILICLEYLKKWNPIDLRMGAGIESFYSQLQTLENTTLNRLIIHIKKHLHDSDYLVDKLIKGFNLDNLSKIDSGIPSLDSVKQINFPVIEGRFIDFRASTTWSEPQVNNFKDFLDTESAIVRNLLQQFNMNITTLEKYIERFRNDIAKDIKNFSVIPSSLVTSTEILERPRTPKGTQVKDIQDKMKILIRNMYEEEKEKINQEAVREEEKVIQDMHSRGILGSSTHINGLKEVEFDRIKSLWKKRIEIEMNTRKGKINENIAREIHDEVSNIIRDEIEVANSRLLKDIQQSGASCNTLSEHLAQKKKEFLKASKRRIDVEIGQRALLQKRTLVSKKEKEDFSHSLKTRFGYNQRKLSNRLKTIKNEKVRSIIKRDIKMAVLCLMYRLWKPCVILCGGIIEGILGDKISTCPKPAITQAYKKSYPGKKLGKSNKYTLENFVDVAFELKIIEKGTRDFAHGIRDYRDYIHPKKEVKQKRSISERDANIACQTVFKILDEI